MSLTPAMHPGPLRTAMLEVCRVHRDIEARGLSGVSELRERAAYDHDAADLLDRYESAVAKRRELAGSVRA